MHHFLRKGSASKWLQNCLDAKCFAKSTLTLVESLKTGSKFLMHLILYQNKVHNLLNLIKYFLVDFFHFIFPYSALISATTDGAARIFPTTLCHGVIRTHVIRVAPWPRPFWRTLYQLSYSSATFLVDNFKLSHLLSAYVNWGKHSDTF